MAHDYLAVYEPPQEYDPIYNPDPAILYHSRILHGITDGIYDRIFTLPNQEYFDQRFNGLAESLNSPEYEYGPPVGHPNWHLKNVTDSMIRDVQTSLVNLAVYNQNYLNQPLNVVLSDTGRIRTALDNEINPKIDGLLANSDNASRLLTDDINPKLDQLLDFDSQIAEDVTSGLADLLQNLAQNIENTLAIDVNIILAQLDLILADTTQIKAATAGSKTTLQEMIANARNDVINGLVDVGNGLTLRVEEAQAATKENQDKGFKQLGADVNESQKTAGNIIADALSRQGESLGILFGPLTDLGTKFMTWVDEDGRDFLSSIIQKQVDISKSNLQAAENLAGHFNHGISDILKGIFSIVILDAWPGWKSVVYNVGAELAPFYQAITTPISGFLAEAGRDLSSPPQWLSAPVDAFVKGFTNKLLSDAHQVMSSRDVSIPKNAESLAADAISFSTTRGMEAYMMSIFMEACIPFKAMGFSNMSALLVDVAAYKPIVSATWGEQIKQAISQPLGYYYAEKFRSAQLDPRDAKELVHKREISLDDYRQALRYAGYNDRLIDALERGVYREPTVNALARMATDTTLAKSDLLRKFQRTGLTDQDAEIFAEAAIEKTQASDRRSLLIELMSHVELGIMPEDQFQIYLDYLALRPEHQDLVKRTANLKATRQDLADYIKLAGDAYYSGMLSQEDYQHTLEGLDVNSDRIAILTAQVQMRLGIAAAKEEKASLKKSIRDTQTAVLKVWKLWLQEGLITTDEFVQNCVQIGYTEEYSTMLAILAIGKPKKAAAAGSAAAAD